MNVLTANAHAFFNGYMSLIWWTDRVGGSLFLLDWLSRRFGHPLEAWLGRQQQSLSGAGNPDRSK